MDSALLLLLPLVGGYLYASQSILTRYKSAREDGHRLYFRAAFWGFILFIGAFLFLKIISYIPKYESFNTEIASFVSSILGSKKLVNSNLELAKIAITALFIGSWLHVPVNYFLEKNKFKYIEKAIENNEFEQLLHHSLLNATPVSVTMENRKVYVGLVIGTFNPEHQRKSIKILPLLSGYRDNDNLQITFNTHYISIYDSITEKEESIKNVSIDNFEIILPNEKIHSLSRFDFETYRILSSKKEKSI